MHYVKQTSTPSERSIPAFCNVKNKNLQRLLEQVVWCTVTPELICCIFPSSFSFHTMKRTKKILHIIKQVTKTVDLPPSWRICRPADWKLSLLSGTEHAARHLQPQQVHTVSYFCFREDFSHTNPSALNSTINNKYQSVCISTCLLCWSQLSTLSLLYVNMRFPCAAHIHTYSYKIDFCRSRTTSGSMISTRVAAFSTHARITLLRFLEKNLVHATSKWP